MVFINMGFFLAEVTMMNFENKEMIENIAKLISNSGLEEERDAETGHDHGKELDLFSPNLLIHHTALTLIATRANHIHDDRYRLSHYLDIFSPPPEV
jgi:hypothetical protein